ncbi:MAG: DUF192 domain-containing protein [bacterium]|nr:DUF192 domain-containing protein [bacterium]
MAARRIPAILISALCVAIPVLGAGGCSGGITEPTATEDNRYLVPATIGGEKFVLETSLTDEQRRLGMGGREEIPEDRGMVFAFPASRNGVQRFYMAGCLVDIDIAYVDDSGRVTKMYTMPKEPPRGEDETLDEYIARLPLYSSGVPVRYAVELKAGTLRRLGVKEGDRIEMDWEWLKEMAR